MSISILTLIALLIVFIILSAFFSLAESAILSTSYEKHYKLALDGSKKAKKLLQLLSKKGAAVSMALLFDNVINVLASSISTLAFVQIFKTQEEGVGIALSTLFMTVTLFIFGEVIPKIVGIRKADKISINIAGLFLLLLKIFSPIVYAIELFSTWFVSLIGLGKIDKETDEDASQSILGAVEMYHQQGNLAAGEKEMLRNVINLFDIDIEDVMTQSDVMYAIDIKLSQDEIFQKILTSPHHKIPFYEGNVDKIVGVLSIRKFIQIYDKKCSMIDIDIRSMLEKPRFVPKGANLGKQLAIFKKNKNHITFVVDEYGNVIGVVTIKDILQHIVGEINEEDDIKIEEHIIKDEDGSFIVNGSVSIKLLNDKIGSNFPDLEFSTIAGIIADKLEYIPDKGDRTEMFNYIIDIVEVSDNKIDKVKLTKISDEIYDKEDKH